MVAVAAGGSGGFAFNNMACAVHHHSPAFTEVAAASTRTCWGFLTGLGQSLWNTRASLAGPRRSITTARIVDMIKACGGAQTLVPIG